MKHTTVSIREDQYDFIKEYNLCLSALVQEKIDEVMKRYEKDFHIIEK